METVKEYMINCQFHGLRFITQEGRHVIERLFWSICVICSWYMSGMLFADYWKSYRDHPVSFVTETDYAHWNTSLFSVSVCEEQNDQKIAEITKMFSDNSFSSLVNMQEVMLEIAFFKGTGAFINKFCLEMNFTCPDGNLKEIATMARSPCTDLFKSCLWMDRSFDCCHYFLPIMTEMGSCFSLNSLQTETRRLRKMESGKTGMGTLRLEMKAASLIYIHGAEEVPFFGTKETDLLLTTADLYKKFTYRVLETVNEPLVREVDIDVRGCRFPDENNLTTYRSYSYSACIVECRMDLQIRLCNCSSHLLNYTKKPCDLRGLQCLQHHLSEHLPVISIALACPHCLPSCTENQYDSMAYETYGVRTGYAEMELALDELPNVRLKRQVVRSKLDLVVSVGGSAGLFVGASMLSFVEVFYYFFIRALWNRFERKRKEKMSKQRRMHM